MPAKATDIWTTWNQSFCLVEGASPVGRRWIHKRLGSCAHQTPVEHRYIAAVVIGAVQEGLLVRDTASDCLARV